MNWFSRVVSLRQNRRKLAIALLSVCLAARLPGGVFEATCSAAELTSQAVLNSIERGREFLLNAQRADGSWQLSGDRKPDSIVMTSFVIKALLNSGLSAQDEPVRRGLDWLRRLDRLPEMTHELALMIEAFAAANDGRNDIERMRVLVQKLESGESRGANDGSWSFGYDDPPDTQERRSKAHFAALALREAQDLGIPVSVATWQRAREHWLSRRNTDGGFGNVSNGSITAAGIAYIVVTEALLRSELPELNADGSPVCCGEPPRDEVVEAAWRWLGNHFAVGHNPGGAVGADRSVALFYYLYCLERAGRLTGRRFIEGRRGDKHDWYREGAEFLIAGQDQLTGAWRGQAAFLEDDPVLATSYALMFLSRGLAPVIINKLQYASAEAVDANSRSATWNRHPDDVRRLTRYMTHLPRWPRFLDSQTVSIADASLADLQQAPILFLHGSDAPQFTPSQVALLREYLLQGGFLFAVRACGSAQFDEGFRDLVRQLFSPTEAPLRRLDPTHPVFRSEYPLFDTQTGETAVELWGVDAGCRTCVMYCPDDLSCLWDKWTSYELPKRSLGLTSMITQAMRVGVNVVAYVTGREPINKLERQESVSPDTEKTAHERDLLQIARLRLGGESDPAPRTVRNLLTALNRTAGLATASDARIVTLADPKLLRYPVAFLHGRSHFSLERSEEDRLRTYLRQGGVLVADACCSSETFDASFRRLMQQLFPDHLLKRIPSDHELFSARIGNDLKTVRRRVAAEQAEPAASSAEIQFVEPELEGIEIDGRIVVIYSRHDISCALEAQASAPCAGYVHEDAVRLGVNIILYALAQ